MILMRSAIFALIGAAVMLCAAPAAAQLERISNRDAAAALRSALEKGSQAAVAQLGRPDGFLGDARVKIPLPDSLQRGERLARRVGMGRYADELITTMNRAAEQAVPEARQLFVDSARKMTVQDAKGILTGGDTAGTEYFRRSTAGAAARALPADREEGHRARRARREIPPLFEPPGRRRADGSGRTPTSTDMSRRKRWRGSTSWWPRKRRRSARTR